MSNLSESKSEYSKSRRFGDLSKVLSEDAVLSRLPTRLAADLEFSEDEDDEVDAATAAAAASPGDSREFPRSCLFADTPRDPDPGGRKYKTEQKFYPKSKRIVKTPTGASLFQRSKPVSLDFESVYRSTLKKISEMGARKSSTNMSSGMVNKSGKVNCSVSPQPPVLASKVPSSPNEEFIKVKGRTYKILSFLGKGGSCKVHAAYDKSTKAVVAIKCVDLSQLDRVVKEGYVKEIKYLESLSNSAYVIKMYDYEYCGNMLYIVLEKGDTDLAHYLADDNTKKNLDPLMVKFYWSQMLKAVAEIHKMGVIHSDLKPENFMLVAGHLKLIDFGIATCVPTDKTSVLRDVLIGTLNYMSPEAISSYTTPGADKAGTQYVFKLSVKADVWSLGCILYYMVYGRTPFQHFPSMIAKIQAIGNPSHKIEYPTNIKDPSVIPVLKSCLERNVKKRASVEDLLRHPYLSAEVEQKPQDQFNKLLSEMQNFTPRKLHAISGVIEKLSQQKQ